MKTNQEIAEEITNLAVNFHIPDRIDMVKGLVTAEVAKVLDANYPPARLRPYETYMAPGNLPNRQLEIMTKLRVAWWYIRVWRSVDSIEDCDREDLLCWQRNQYEIGLGASGTAGNWIAHARGLIQQLETFPRVTAIEILDDQGNGIIVYPDWR